MFFKQNLKEQTIRLFLLIFISLFILINFKNQLPLYFDSLKIIKTGQAQPVGKEFVPLIPLMKNVPWAGFLTCVHSSHPMTDPNVMGPYQQAQFVLSPTILDYFHPFDYLFIVLQCDDPSVHWPVKGPLSVYKVQYHSQSVSLVYRKKILK